MVDWQPRRESMAADDWHPEGMLQMSEKQFLAQVLHVAQLYGWRCYHPWISVRSAEGWPDLALCKPPVLWLVELKTEKGKLTPDQEAWGEALQQCQGVRYAVWRPSMWLEIVRVLSGESA